MALIFFFCENQKLQACFIDREVCNHAAVAIAAFPTIPHRWVVSERLNAHLSQVSNASNR